MLPFFVG